MTVSKNIVTVYLNANGGSVTQETISVESGGTVELPKPTRNGYSFEGWFTSLEGGTEVTSDSLIDKDITLYAHWKEYEDYISFSVNEATVPNGECVFIECY